MLSRHRIPFTCLALGWLIGMNSCTSQDAGHEGSGVGLGGSDAHGGFGAGGSAIGGSLTGGAPNAAAGGSVAGSGVSVGAGSSGTLNTGGIANAGGTLNAGGIANAGGTLNTGGIANAGGRVPTSAGGTATGTLGGSGGAAASQGGKANGALGGSGGTKANGGSFNGGSSNGGSSNGGTGGKSASGGSLNGAGGSLAGAGGSLTGAGGSSPFPPGVVKPRIMIVGDSISAGPGCYKKYLLQALNQNGYSNFQFVGEYGDDCGGGVRHSAVSCSTAEQFTQATFTMPNCSQGKTFPGLSTLMKTHTPDMVMIQLGVNDVWGGKTTDKILGSYTTLVQQARAANPAVVLVVAEIAKMRPNCSDDAAAQRAQALVTAVPAWAKQQSTSQSTVYVADLWTNSDASQAETLDCIHPNDTGAQRMGLNWYNALKGILPH